MNRVRRLELLVRAVDAGSFAKAARSLNLTPSAVSHGIAQLEQELQVQLFYRTTRQLRLTEDGEGIYRRGSEILRQIAALDSERRRPAANLTGTLRVGLALPLSRLVIMPLLPVFLRRHPKITLQFHMMGEIKEMHAQGADLFLSVTDPPDSALIARKIAHTLPGIYASPQYLEVAGVPQVPEDLIRHHCLVLNVRSLSKPLDEWEFERNGKRKRVKVIAGVTTYDREGLIAAVVAGAGVMHMGCFDPNLVRSGQLQRLLTDWSCPGGVPIQALYRKTARLPPKIAAFLDFAEEAFAAFDPEEVTLIHREHIGIARSKEAAVHKSSRG
ncbi:MAG: LysR family transcriptional regulator [Burkholderiales bacterium]